MMMKEAQNSRVPELDARNSPMPPSDGYKLPSVAMLARGNPDVYPEEQEILRVRYILQQTLKSFKIRGEVSGYVSGPRITRFEITLAPGVNVKKVEQIAGNIAMNLAETSIRVLAPIPGRPVVSIEVPNLKREPVFLRTVVMKSKAWKNDKVEIPLALGEDVSGDPVVIDLAKVPHLLIAGAVWTTICTDTLIMSLLLSFTPADLKLIMIDHFELQGYSNLSHLPTPLHMLHGFGTWQNYRNLPHLLTPLITDKTGATAALRRAAEEVDRRCNIMAKLHIRELAEFNRRPPDPEPVYDTDGSVIPPKMPYVVIFINELADLMMPEAKNDVENSIVRIAPNGRAAGIHIVVATRRPSTNIITGVVKDNLPTRFCFQVRSGVDSRVVLDTVGAEKLLGKGDMLLMSPSDMNLKRVQCVCEPFSDICKILDFVCSQAKPNFDAAEVVDE